METGKLLEFANELQDDTSFQRFREQRAKDAANDEVRELVLLFDTANGHLTGVVQPYAATKLFKVTVEDIWQAATTESVIQGFAIRWADRVYSGEELIYHEDSWGQDELTLQTYNERALMLDALAYMEDNM